MRIQNDPMPRYSPAAHRTNNPAAPGVQPDFRHSFDSYNGSIHHPNAETASNVMPDAPQSVKDPQEKAEQEAGKVSPAALYEQMTGRTVAAEEPSYTLTQEQISDLKSRYDIGSISGAEYQSLMKELAEMGVVSKTEVASTFASRPIVVGIFPTETHKQLFEYASFDSGNVLEWAQSLADKCKNGISWITESKENGNRPETNERNIKSLQAFSESISRTLQVLDQLK